MTNGVLPSEPIENIIARLTPEEYEDLRKRLSMATFLDINNRAAFAPGGRYAA